MNLHILVGTLGKEPELKHTGSGTAVTKLSIATEYSKKTANGYQRETTWHDVIVWATQAENACKWLKKGSKISVQGRIDKRDYENNQGTKVYVTETVAEKIEYLANIRTKEEVDGNQTQQQPSSDSLDSIPF